MKTLKGTIPLLCLAALAWSSPAFAQTVPFKLYITELWQLDVDQDIGIGVIGDFYAKVTINGVEHDNKQGGDGACNDESSTGLIVPLQLFKNFKKIPECQVSTPWVFSQQVPAGQPVHVRIQIFDTDTLFDDEADLKVGDGDAINIDVNPFSGTWTGDITSPQNCSRPGLNLGGNNANVCWQAGFDTDDDGLLDSWEKFGVDTDNDGLTDIDLHALGADPLRKDVFVEADFLRASTHTHAPNKDAIERVVASFANAPISNPDGTTGVQLHVDTGPLYGAGLRFPVTGPAGVVGTYGDLDGGGSVIAETVDTEIIDAFGKGKGPGAKFEDLKAANFDPLREPIFRYVIFGHQTNGRFAKNDCTTGVANPTRRDFLVTLGGIDLDGNPCWGTVGPFSVGSSAQQSGTFMHELGHALSLQHGGNDNVNDKPNYLSVMNYSFQECKVPTTAGVVPGGCDYSRLVLGKLLDPLDETNLDECVGLGGGLTGKVDWNGNKIFEGESRCGLIFANATADVNNDGVCISPGPNGRPDTAEAGDDKIKEFRVNDGPNRFCQTTAKPGSDDVQVVAVGDTPNQPDVLKSFDDWDNLSFSLIESSGGGGTGAFDPAQEADPRTIADSRRFMGDLMAPHITVDQTGPASAKPGDVLNYSVKIANTGRGPAMAAVLQEKSPDGTVTTTDLGTITVDSELTRPRSFTVPANACPGSFTNASASLNFTDFPGQEFTASATTPLQILDVAAPTFDVSLSPDILWEPSHDLIEITATIAVNDNCDRNPTVTLVSITSNEPESGFLGQGDKAPDIDGAAFGTDDRTFFVRAERGTGQGRTGRVYSVTYRVTDKSGNATTKTATVTVPNSQGDN
jgi:hypothetical protein